MVLQYKIQDGTLVETQDETSSVMLFIDPDAQERKRLVDEMKIDEHNLNSALDPEEISRIEFEPQHTALILQSPKNYSTKDFYLFKISSIGIFLFADRLVLVMSENTGILKGRLFSTKILSLNDCMLKIVYGIVSHFFGHLKVMSMVSDSLELQINAAIENRHLTNMFSLEKSLLYYRHAIGANNAVLEKLKAHTDSISLSDADRKYLDDILIDNAQCSRQAEIYTGVLTGVMNARASIVSNNRNVLIKTLNIIIISILVPTFIVSAFSVHVNLHFRDHPAFFWIILGLGLIIMAAFLIAFNLFYKKRQR